MMTLGTMLATVGTVASLLRGSDASGLVYKWAAPVTASLFAMDCYDPNYPTLGPTHETFSPAFLCATRARQPVNRVRLMDCKRPLAVRRWRCRITECEPWGGPPDGQGTVCSRLTDEADVTCTYPEVGGCPRGLFCGDAPRPTGGPVTRDVVP